MQPASPWSLDHVRRGVAPPPNNIFPHSIFYTLFSFWDGSTSNFLSSINPLPFSKLLRPRTFKHPSLKPFSACSAPLEPLCLYAFCLSFFLKDDGPAPRTLCHFRRLLRNAWLQLAHFRAFLLYYLAFL